MFDKYYTYVSVNGKSIRIEESESEHEARVRRMRAIERKRQQEERERAMGLYKNVHFICQGCGRQIPSTTQTRTGDYYCKHCGRAGKNYKNGPAV